MDQVVKKLETALRVGTLKKEDFFSTSVFYYLSGCFPNLSMNICCCAVSKVREKLIKVEI